ncbi:transposase family protein, partial [Longimycelium tulufanense]|uniref:transposase family protein n=1 Tax=Longimycelium tulufanense TaxID=907463 RepID=UPI00166A0FAF
MIAYRATLDLPRELAWYLAGLLRADQRQRRTPKGRRALSVFRHAVLALRWFREGTRVAQLARDTSISIATAYRYLHEAIDVLAGQAPELPDVLADCLRENTPYVILDGKLVPTDRVAARADEGHHLWYSGNHHKFGGNIQFVAAPDGFPLWVSDVAPGSFVDLPVAVDQALGALYHAAAQGLPTLADKGYQGAGIGVHTPIKNPRGGNVLDVDNRCHNTLLTRLRCRGERAMALLTQRWRPLQRITLCPWHIGD